MRKILGICGIFICGALFFGSFAFAGLDVLDGMSITSTRPPSSGEFFFCPGDQVVQEGNYTVFYSGFQTKNAEDTLFFTVVEDAYTFQVFFPTPDIITIKDVSMRILAYDNRSLKIQFIEA